MSETDRRTLLKFAAAGVFSASAFSQVGPHVVAQDATTIRYGWWGGTARQQSYTAAFEAFEAENPDIKIEKEFADYDAFQERMTTQMAAGDVPDIFWIASPQVLTYEQNDLFRQLDDIETFDLSDFDEETLEPIRLNGVLNSIPNGVFVPVVRYNETFANEDRVELPTEESGNWNWDGLAAFLTDYANNNSSGRKAITYDANADLPFEAWCRQHGEQLWSEDGNIGFSEETLAGWFDWWENLRKAGAALSLSEQEGPSKDWQLVGDKVLVTFQNSNHIIDDAKVFPDYTFRMRPMPILDGAEEGHKFLYFPRQTIYQGIEESKVPAAGKVLNYIINTPDFLKVTGLTMGAPINPRVREEVRAFASDNELHMLDIVNGETEATRRPRYEAPAGSNNWRTVMARVIEEVALERTSPTDAASRMIQEVSAEIERAR